MVREAKAHGLLVDPGKELKVVGPPGCWLTLKRYDAPADESLEGAWKLAEYVPKSHYNTPPARSSFTLTTVSTAPLIPAPSSIAPPTFARAASTNTSFP
jgi:hypothetical protein